MNLSHKTGLLGIAALVAATTTGRAAHAFGHIETCNGEPVILDTLQLDLNRDACSIVSGTGRHEMYTQTATLYDRVSNIPVFTDTVTEDCQVEIGDWLNEVAFTVRSNIDGNNGLTFYAHENLCFNPIGPGDYGETDAFVAHDLSATNPPQEFFGGQNTTNPGQARVTFVHEMSHMLGLDDTGAAFNYMNLANRHPMRGGTGAHAAPFPDEVAGIRSLYGTKAAVNMFASAQGFASNNVVVNLHDTNRTFCRNGSFMSWTAVNVGNTNRTFNQRIILSTDATLGTGDRTWISWLGGTVNARNFFTWAGAFLVPAGVPNGTYHVFHLISPIAGDATTVDDQAHHAGLITITDC